MRNKSFKRVGAALMAAILMMSSFGNLSAVQAEEIQVRTDSNAQMSSDKEVVYVNTYDAAVREQNFDENWKFYLGEASGAESTTFDDSRWDSVNLPHDYSIEQEFTSSGEAESAYLLGGTGWYRKHFTLSSDMAGKEIRIDFGGVYMNATVWVNGTKLGTHPYGYTPFSFDITDYVEFDKENVITVKVDHQTPSSRWYSGSGIYRSVNLTVMDKVHVDLYGTKITTPDLATEAGGTVNMSVVTTVANENIEAKDVVLTHTVYEKGTENRIGTVTTEAASVAAGESKEINATVPANNPKLWGLGEENANLYTVVTEVKVGEDVVDTYETDYGFRYFSFDTDEGFILNGENVKLKGVCMHHDQGSLGAEAYYRAIERQVEILQEMGCNSIRVTHNPAADELIEICNEKGMLVIDEAFDGWMYNKNGNTYDYSVWFETAIEEDNQIIGADAEPMDASANDDILGSVSGLSWAQFDLTSMIKRGQNAPSIIMWSLGNEVWEGTGLSGYDYPKVAATLSTWAKNLDGSRPSTIGDNYLKHQNEYSYAMAEALEAVGGIVGGNYCVQDGERHDYDIVHADHSEWPLYGSETASAVNSRGVYDTTANSSLNADKELTSYDYSSVGWGNVASSAWYDVITRDFVAGEYVWTGFDYLGEPTPANGTNSGWKSGTNSPKNSFFGIIDTAGLPKDTYYFYQSQWNDEVNTLHVLPAWNEDVVVSGNVPIVVYSDAAAVELFFTDTEGNRESLGKKEFTQYTTEAGYTYQMYEGDGAASTTHQNMYLTWYKAFEEGTIEAVAYDKGGNVISATEGRSSVTTTGAATQLSATVDREEIAADGKDLAYITVDVKDADGNIVPDAANNVRFDVEGDGVLVGVDNGKQSDHQSFQDDNRDAYNGSLVAIVQSTKEAGSFTVTAQSAGLTSDAVTVTTTAVDTGVTGEKRVDSFYMSKNYYVKSGSEVVLPTTIETRYTDGSSENLPVVWDEITETTGTFGVNGVVDEQYSVSVVVNMIDEVGGLLNYSTTTQIGVPAVLPGSRPAVLVDGTVLNVSFPVTWESVGDNAYTEAGTFTVNGTANVLGKPIDVTASIRVQEETITVSGSVDNPLTLSQDIPADKQSDTLTAIWDGSTEVGDNNDGGANETAWTNWQNSQGDAGDTTAEITFEYATQQRAGEIVIHFFRDEGSARFPAAGATEIYMSDTGADGSWTKIAAEETIGEEAERVKAYTYKFTPFTATFIKFCFTNAEKTSDMSQNPCTGITEIEIKKATGTFTTNSTAELASLEVNGVALTEAELAKGVYYTLEETATVAAAGADNAAVTVLPAYEKEILLIIESEDHKTRETFTIKLEQEAPIDPEYSGKDIPVSVLTATAGDEQSEGEGAAKVLDNDSNTKWHTDWSGTSRENHYIDFVLSEEYMVDGLRYQPRQDNSQNGNITEYEIKVSNDGNSWTSVANGTWESDAAWKAASFSAQNVKYVRLVAVNAATDNTYVFASAAEIRLTGTKVEESTPDAELVGIAIATPPKKTYYTVGETFSPEGLVLTLVYSDGSTNNVAYSADAGIEYDLTEALTIANTSVKINYDGKETVLGITVTAASEADGTSGEIPVAVLKATAGSAEELSTTNTTEGPASLALDGLDTTLWHSKWAGDDRANLWIQFELTEDYKVDGLKYLPRKDAGGTDTFGTITEYKIQVSDNASEWTDVATGSDWANDNTWKTATFDAVNAKFVRLVAVASVSDNRQFASAAEIRLTGTKVDTSTPEVELGGISVKEAPEKVVYTVGEAFEPTGLILNLVYNNGETGTIAYPADALTYEPTTAFTEAGNKTVTITYTEDGVIKTTTLDVYVQEPVTLTGISVATAPTQTTYTEGDTFDPTGLVLNLAYSNGTTGTVAYSGNESAFEFNPGLNAELTTDNTSVTIKYSGFVTIQNITVNGAATLESISVKTAPNKIVYEQGENLDPAGLVLTLTYSDTHTEELAYSEANKEEFGFNPQDNLQTSTERVTVTYEDKTAQIAVIVKGDDQNVDQEAPEVPVTPETPEVVVPTTPATPDAEYEIYPNPQDMTYYEGSWLLRSQTNVVYEDGIDDVTKARLAKALSQKGMSVTEGRELAAGKTNILVGTYDSNGYVDQFVKDNFEVSEGLFDKIDAYFLASTKDTIIVLGKDTDAAFYGLTSLYHIFTQMEGKEIESFIMEDWADTAIRGFIEGYYGIPWSNEDRMSLMEFGGNFKMTSYVFAPKDDQYHTSKWRELYPEDEINAIAEMVKVGNDEKCRFVWTAHPFMGGFNSNDVDGEIEALLAKFDQLYSAGVRQFGVLGDDVGSLNKDIIIQVMNAVSDWANEKGDVYDSVFCPAGYNHSWQGDYSELNTYDAGFPDDVQIFWTGEAVCQPVEQVTLDHFRNHNAQNGERRAPLFWLNWPVNDINHSRMLMGKGSLLETDINVEDLAGLVTNPMQEAEASKVAIFAVADYAWNVKAFDDDQSWEDSFAYIETDAAEELHTLAKHMSDPSPNGHGLVLAESEELQPLIEEFENKLAANQSLAAAGAELVAEMDVIIDACDGFHANSKNENLKEELLPFTGSLKDLATAIKNYTLAAMALEEGKGTEAFEYYCVGLEAHENSQTHVKVGKDGIEYADPGSKYLIPLAGTIQEAIADEVTEYALGTDDSVKFTATSSFGSFYNGAIENIVDGNNNTHAWYGNYEAVNQYYQVNLSKPSTVYGVDILNGANSDGKGQDTFKSAKLQYTTDGTTWIDVPNGATTTEYPETFAVNGLELENVVAVRYICTAAGNKWPSMREFTVKLTKEATTPEFTCEVIRTTNAEGWVASSDAAVIDGDESTSVHYTVRSTQEANEAGYKDSMLEGDYIGLKLSQPITLGRVRIVQGRDDSDMDYMQNAKLQYSMNGTDWTDVPNGATTERTIDKNLSSLNIEAQYVRLVLTSERQSNWFAIREFTVEAKQEYNSSAYTNADVYEDAPANIGKDTHELIAIDDVTLAAGEYIGLKLDRIHELSEIEVNDGTIPAGLTLQVSMNSVEWDNVNPGTVSKDARYIRLVNEGNADVTFDITKFAVSTVEVEDKSIESTNYSSINGDISQLFDGDWTTAVHFTNSQHAGKYIVIDLGSTITLESFKAVCRDGEHDFVRHGKFSGSADGSSWTTIMTIGSETGENDGEATNTDNINDVLPDHEISYNTKSVTGLNTAVRYLKFEVTRTKTGSDKWVRFQEFEINGGAYIPTENNPTVEGPGETRDYQYRSMTDGNLSTMYTWMNEDVIYHESEEEAMNTVKIVQNGISNATVSVRLAGETEYTEIGTLSQTINEFNVGADQILDVKITPAAEETPVSITEMSFAQKDIGSVNKTALEALVNAPEDTDNWTDETKAAYEEVLEKAEAICESGYASQATVDSMVQALQKAIDSKELKGDPEVVEAELAKEKLGEEAYTAASWKEYEKVVNTANAALEDEDNLSEADVATLVADLKAAREALRYNPTNYEDAALYLNDLAVLEELEENYTTDSYAEFERLYDALKEMIGVGPQAQYTPENFADAKDALSDAVKALVPVYELPDLVDEFNETDESIYTDKSWDKYEAAVNAVVNDEVLKSGSKSDVMDAIKDIKSAKDKLAVKADKDALEKLIEQANAYNEEDYTTESFEAFKDVLEEIKLKDLDSMSTKELQKAGNDLQDKINDLVSVKELKELVAEAEDMKESDYTTSSYEKLKEAIEDAKACYDDGTEKSVRKAIDQLTKAILGLESAANKDDASKYVDSIVLKDTDPYTKESAKKYLDAYNKLKELVKNIDDVSAAEFTAAKIAFEEAEDGLELRKTSSGGDSSSEDKSGTTSGSGSTSAAVIPGATAQGASTGDSANIVPFIVILIVAAAAFGFVQYKKKRDKK